MEAPIKSLTCRDDASVPVQSCELEVGQDLKPGTCLRSKAASPVLGLVELVAHDPCDLFHLQDEAARVRTG